MIAKITRGHDMAGAVKYLFGKGKANEHTNPHVVAGDGGLSVESGRVLSDEEVRELATEMDLPRAIFETEVPDGNVWHLSLSTRDSDRALSDAEWGEIATSTMDAMGFSEANGKAQCSWVAVRHGVSVAGNEHIHLVASLVRDDGTKASVWRDRVTMSKVCADVEQRYGLYVVEGRTTKGMPGLTRGELERTEREQTPEPVRTTVARRVREASVAAKDEAEFVRRLKGAGLVVCPRYADGGKATVVGYAVGVKGNLTADGTQITFGGGKLGADLTLPRLRQYWESTPDDREAAVAQWGAARPLVKGGRETSRVAASEWQGMAASVERTNARLQWSRSRTGLPGQGQHEELRAPSLRGRGGSRMEGLGRWPTQLMRWRGQRRWRLMGRSQRPARQPPTGGRR